jgi:LysR family transcriptional regulator, regulator of abg operon
MRFSQLRNFIAVVDAGGIQRAARVLGVSQPAVTRSIRLLEEELHVQLLERSARGVVPTREGKAFLARARAVQNELHRAGNELAELSGQGSGRVSFGVTPEAGVHLLPEALSQFRTARPGAELYIVEGLPHALLPRLRDGSLDFLLGARPRGPLEPSVEGHPLFRAERLIAGRRGHPLRKAAALADLLAAEWVVFAPPGWSASIIPAFFEEHGIEPPRSIVRCESYPTLLALVARTDMVAALSSRLLNSRQGRQLYQPFALKQRLPPFTIHLFQRTDVPLTPAAGAMVTTLRSAARRLVLSRSDP